MIITRAAAALAIVIVAATVPASAQSSPSPAPPPASPPSASPAPAAASPAPAPASPVPANAASPAPGTTADANAAKARVEFEAWQNGKIDLSHYIPEAAKQFTDAVVRSISEQSLKPLGAVKTLTQIRVVTTPVAVIHVYHVVCANGAMDEAISWDAAGKIQYIQFATPQG